MKMARSARFERTTFGFGEAPSLMGFN